MTDPNCEVLCAVNSGNLERVIKMIDSNGLAGDYVLLRTAVENNYTEIARLLLARGCRVNSKNTLLRGVSSDTPLHYAVRNKNKDVVQLLLSNGAAIEVFDTSGKTPLHYSVQGLLDITEQLLRSGANVNCISKNLQYTPLHYAVERDDIAMTNLLLNNGARVNAVAKDYFFTPMHIASCRNNFQIVERLLSHGADVNVRTVDGFQPLYFAISNHNEDMIQLLLQNKAEVNDLTNEKKQSPICMAIEYDYYKAAVILINQGADVNIANVDGYTPLHYAARNDNENIIQLLLNKNAEVNSLTNKNQTPLYIAINNYSYKAAFILLNHGSTIDSQDNEGKSILYLAVEIGNAEIVREILKLRPDIDNNSNKKAFQFAALYADSEVVQDLIEYGFTVGPEDVEDGDLLHVAAQMGYFEIVKDLLRLGANVSFRQNGCTPLHTAVKNDQVQIASLLIEYGADVNAKDKEGKPPIFHSVYSSNLVLTEMLLARGVNVRENTELVRIATNKVCKEMVEVLIENDCDIGATDRYGRTALHLTAQNEYDGCIGSLQHDKHNIDIEARGDIAKLLLKNGADVNAKTKSGFTALHLACQRGFSYVVEALLEYKADVEYFTDGCTPLIASASKGNVLIIEMLLKKGANINAKDQDNGRTALHYAAHGGHTDALTVLLKENPEVNSQDIEGQTPLHLAASKNVLEAVEVLLNHGANIDDVDNEGQTALHVASKKGNDAILELLLKFGADVNIMTKRNLSPLDVAGWDVVKYADRRPRSYNYSDDEDYYDCYGHYDRYDRCGFQRYDDDYDDDGESTREILIKRLITMEIGNLYLNKSNRKYVPLGKMYSDFCTSSHHILIADCREEVERMKKKKIKNTKVKLYDILTEDVGWLAKYAKNEDIVGSLMSGCYEDEFPIYFADLRRNIKKGIERKHLLEQSQRFFEDLLGFPYACADQILEFLSNVDIKSMIQVYEQSVT